MFINSEHPSFLVFRRSVTVSSLGVFPELVEIVNRCPWDLSVMFDGQTKTLPPGKNLVPGVTLQYALNQNPLMGSGDLNNPTVTGCQYLIGIVGRERQYPCEPLTAEQIEAQTNNPCRWDYLELMEERMDRKTEHVVVKGRKTPSMYEVKQNIGNSVENFTSGILNPE